MNVLYGRNFKKKFNKLNLKTQNRFFERMEIFVKNRTAFALKDHPLKGNLVGYRSFAVTGNYRIIYRIVSKDTVKFVTIGTHSQLY